ncbi:MAG: 4Fe-4S binding protein [Candidatus Verstraetearchaeota archaeon]|nr:4Fe-4S binding protein [Candidatus Verstraetearchaeota archaeon]
MAIFAVEFDGRGVTQTALMRAASEIICIAADKEGFPSLGYERYDDAPDRVGVPIKGFSIISRTAPSSYEKDLEDVAIDVEKLSPPTSDYSNYQMCYDELAPEAMLYEPRAVDAVLVLDDTLVKGEEPWAYIGVQPIHEKLKDGGAIIVNSKRDPEYLLEFIHPTTKRYKLAVIDADSMDKIIILPLIGAMLRVAPGIVSYRAVIATVKERYKAEGVKKAQVIKDAYNKVRWIEVPPAKQPIQIKRKMRLFEEFPKWHEMPEGIVVYAPPVNGPNPHFKTDTFRTYRPITDPNKCNKDGLCWLYCPDSARSPDPETLFAVNLEYCKGCGVCAEVCPTKAIKMVNELDFRGEKIW